MRFGKLRKTVALVLAGMMIMTVSGGCTSSNNDTTVSNVNDSTESVSEENVSTETETSENTAEDTSSKEYAVAENVPTGNLPVGKDSLEYAVLMGNGINLGNTMEAYGHKDGIDKEVSYYETLWGQPVTTQKMIDDMKASGLDTLRIPVAWTNKMDFENGDYTISEDYLARVREIVDMAYAADMYVIINDHWDGGWWGLFGSADEKKRAAAMDQYISMWQQIAEYFKDYDHQLIFEGANEEVGDRLNDIDADFNRDGAVLTKDECYSKSNEINQTFVDTVRATGGNNADRFLLIPGYGTDVTQTMDDRWHMPKDTANGKLFLSVHYYTPWSFCGSSGASTWGTKKNYEEMNNLLTALYEKYGKDYGIIIGECGVLPTSKGEAKPNTLLWYKNFYANCDRYGFVPLLWNTGDILKKADGSWFSDEIKDFLLEKSYKNEKDKTEEDLIAEAEKTINEGMENAPETFQTEDKLTDDGKAVAWIMWDSQDWNIVYSVGDTYDPDTMTEGLVPTDVEITGEGTYTVGLDFTGTDAGSSISTAFSAIGIANGEALFPGYIITIKKVLINGEEYKLHGRNYTSSDDGLCTRTNLYNEWVPEVPEDARTNGGGTMGCSPCVFDQKDLGEIKTLEITFDYTPGAEGISTNDANSKN